MASVDMFDYLLRDNKLEEEFLRYGLDKNDIIFIKEQIEGPRANENISQVQVRRREPSPHQSQIIGAPNSSLDPSYFPGGVALCRPTRRKELSL